jgi:CRP/FNR family transcriptional regulator, cyclic AMP receptor protein
VVNWNIMALPFGDVPFRTFKRGEVIFRQGDDGSGECYLVHEGKVEVRRAVDSVERVLRTLVKGDLLGEVALFRDAPHSATAVAAERVTLLVISADRLEYMVRTHPGLAIALIRQLARMAAGEDRTRGHGKSFRSG